MSKKPGKDAGQDLPVTETSDQPKMTRAERRALDAQKLMIAQRQKLLLMLVAATVVVNALLGYLLYESMVVEKQRTRIADAAQIAAATIAHDLSDRLRERQAEVQSWAQDPALLEALQTNDQATLTRLTKTFAATRSDILAVRVFPIDTITLDRNHIAPIRYAEIDLVRRSTRRQQVLPEAAIFADKDWQLHIAHPIPPTGEHNAPGSLLVSYSNTQLVPAMAQGDSSYGAAALQQSFGGMAPANLEVRGQGDAAPARIEKIPNSYWQVQFTPSAALVAESEELPSLWLVTISLSVTLCLGLALVLSKLLVRAGKTAPGEGLNLPQGYVDSRNTETTNTANTPATDAPGPGSLYHRQDILDIEVVEEDEDILGLASAAPRRAVAPATNAPERDLPMEIFRAYDIRGEVGVNLTPELAREIGMAIGSEAQDQGEGDIIVGRDGRTHSPELTEQLVAGILASGCNVLDIGIVPTPLMHFATFEFSETSSGVMVTASHNGAAYNGFKVVVKGETLSDDAIVDLATRIRRRQYLEGDGQLETRSIIPQYIDRIFSDVALAGDISVVIDAGNAVAGVVAPALFEELGCNVIPLNCELDGNFPNHDPDPTIVANLAQLIDEVKASNADLGIAFDGDGDRLIVVTPSGRIIWPDQLLMLFARDILSRNPGADILFDVKCSKQLNQVISGYGGRPIMWKTGHSHMKQKMLETGALIGGEYSGHIFIKERWYGFDDGLYTAARLLEIITLRDQPIDEIFATFPMLPSTPEIRVPVPDTQKFLLVEQLIKNGDFQSGKPTTIDGLRVDFSKGWGLVRASNTSAEITLRFEAENEDTLEKLQQLFKRELLKIDNSLQLNF